MYMEIPHENTSHEGFFRFKKIILIYYFGLSKYITREYREELN